MDIIDTPVQNGNVNLVEDFKPYEALPTLQTGVLRRLARLGAAVEGATDVAQAAINAHNSRRTAYQEAFQAACEDAGIEIPPGEHDVQIDWQRGNVTFIPKVT